MKPLLRNALVAIVLLSGAHFYAPPARAQSAAIVEGVQMPAWVERGNARIPILPGMTLQPGDLIRTGAGSRLVVRLSERSLIKLGENGELRFTELSRSRELFKAALHLFEGAFRFTTDLAMKSRRREVSISVANVTAGIRGTDLWGKSQGENQTICLIEGAIEVQPPGEPALAMNQARQFYRRLGGKSQPLGFVEPAMLAKWSAETELQQGRPTLRPGGRFAATLARAESQETALGIYDRLRAAGYPAEIHPRREAGKLVYIVRIRQLASRADARALESQLRSGL